MSENPCSFYWTQITQEPKNLKFGGRYTSFDIFATSETSTTPTPFHSKILVSIYFVPTYPWTTSPLISQSKWLWCVSFWDCSTKQEKIEHFARHKVTSWLLSFWQVVDIDCQYFIHNSHWPSHSQANSLIARFMADFLTSADKVFQAFTSMQN